MTPQIDKDLDLDHDGIVTAEEVSVATEIYKSDTMRKQSWVALSAMVAYPILCAFGPLSGDRLETLASLSDLFFLSMAGIVGATYGAEIMKRRGS
tara:strand:+ start:897 stop:1181 length:285 start_codon:yes stop_codon:yes gene_type:complete